MTMTKKTSLFVILAFFTVMLTALTSCETGGHSSSSVMIIPKPTGVTAPSGIAAVAGNGSVTLTWTSVSAATSYNIYMDAQTGVSKSSYGDKFSSDATSFTTASLQNGAKYYFVITAVNATGESGESTEISATPTLNNPSFVTISGTILYEDKEYGVNGFTGLTFYKPVRYADVEVVDSSTPGAPTLSFGSTGTDGTYSFVVSLNTNSLLYVRVISSVTFTAGSALEVKHTSGAGLYSVSTGNFTPSGDAQVNISVPSLNPAGGAFNILDVYTSGFEFVHSLTGSVYPPALNAYWQVGNGNGTWYCNAPGSGCSLGIGIYVVGGYDGSGDTDQYDDDVLLHEFGHFIAEGFSKDESPGGIHWLNQNDEDLRLSWSEGWGNFFQGAVKKWLSLTDPSLLSTSGLPTSGYVDTADDAAQIYFNFSSPPDYSTDFMYSSSEVAVAKILLDLRDTVSMNAIWNVITSYATSNPATPVNLELFVNRWLSQGNVYPAGILYGRAVFYSDDGYEPDDSLLRAYAGSPEVHNLYKTGGDKDIVFFYATAGSPYTIKTQNLSNGADTFLTLLDTDGASVKTTNDNWNKVEPYLVDGYYDIFGNYIYPLNDALTLSSKIAFTPAISGTYYVQVETSPDAPHSAGRYGAYTLSITSP